jgi:FkbM family methyltransferase
VLISMQELQGDHGVTPHGVLHLGGHLGEERDAYRAAKVGKVWWVEANPAKLPDLRFNVFPDVVIHACVGEHEGQSATLRIANNGQSSSVFQFGTHRREHPKVRMTGETVVLPTRTVDLLAIEHDIEADFLNIDLQGAELAALKGAVRFLSGVKWIYCEVNDRHLYRGCPLVGEIDDYLAAHGFEGKATRMTRHHWGDKIYSRRTQ